MTTTRIARPARMRSRATAGLLAVALASTAACADSPVEGDGDRDAAGVDAPPSSSPEPSEPASTTADPTLTSLTDTFDDDGNGWALPPNEVGTTTVADGDFVWDFTQFGQRPHLLAATVADAFDAGQLDMVDVRVATTVTPERGGAAFGVFCREVPDTDSDFHWYEFVVRDGYAAIRQADSAGNLEVLAESDDVEVPLGEEAALAATCVDVDGEARLALALGGSEVLETSVPEPLGNGGAGLAAYDAMEDAADQPMLIVWHDFEVAPAGS